MKLSIDGSLCRGHGRCYTLAEDLLEDDDEGFVTARGQIIDVPDDQVEDARNAGAEVVAVGCPQCTAMLEGVVGDRPEILDIAELVAEALGDRP